MPGGSAVNIVLVPLEQLTEQNLLIISFCIRVKCILIALVAHVHPYKRAMHLSSFPVGPHFEVCASQFSPYKGVKRTPIHGCDACPYKRAAHLGSVLIGAQLEVCLSRFGPYRDSRTMLGQVLGSAGCSVCAGLAQAGRWFEVKLVSVPPLTTRGSLRFL